MAHEHTSAHNGVPPTVYEIRHTDPDGQLQVVRLEAHSIIVVTAAVRTVPCSHCGDPTEAAEFHVFNRSREEFYGYAAGILVDLVEKKGVTYVPFRDGRAV